MLFSNLGFVDTLLAFGYIVDVAAEWVRKTGAVHKGLSVIWKKIMGHTTNRTMVEIDRWVEFDGDNDGRIEEEIRRHIG